MVFFWQRKNRPARSSRDMSSSTSSSFLAHTHQHTSSLSSSSPSSSPSSSSSSRHQFNHGTSSRPIGRWPRDGQTQPRRKSSGGSDARRDSSDAGDAAGMSGGASGVRGHPQDNSSSSSKSHQAASRPLTGMLVLDKLVEFSRRKQETDRRRVAEKELDSLNMKINKLLSKMGEAETETVGKMKLDEECVVCLAAPATMRTFPCGHKVVCRKCLIKTIQVAVSQRCLPLRCVICRDRILKLHHATHPQPHPFDFSVSSSHAHHGAPPHITVTNPAGGGVPLLHPASPSKMFSLMTSGSGRTCSTSPKLLPPSSQPPPGQCPTSPRHGASERSQSSSQSDELPPRYSPANLEAFVHSHNDALNLQPQDASSKKPPTTSETRSAHKASAASQAVPAHSKRHDPACINFMGSQSVKIHPKVPNQICAFMDSSAGESSPNAPPGSAKSTKTNRFIAKFLPRGGNRRKHIWNRHE